MLGVSGQIYPVFFISRFRPFYIWYPAIFISGIRPFLYLISGFLYLDSGLSFIQYPAFFISGIRPFLYSVSGFYISGILLFYIWYPFFLTWYLAFLYLVSGLFYIRYPVFLYPARHQIFGGTCSLVFYKQETRTSKNYYEELL